MLALHVPHGVLDSSVFNSPVAFAFESNLPANVALSIVAEKLPAEIFCAQVPLARSTDGTEAGSFAFQLKFDSRLRNHPIFHRESEDATV